MEIETATPETAPVETPLAGNDALADFLAEDDEPNSDNSAEGDAQEAPETEEDAQVEAEEAEATEETPSEDPVYKVKVRGEDVDVPLSELLKGYSRTEDYKAKTAEVADLKRQVASEYAERLEQATAIFEALDPVLSQCRDLDWTALAREDPNTYVALKAAYDERLNILQSASQEIGQIRQSQTEEQLTKTLQAEQQALLKAMPELADEATFSSFSGQVSDYLKSTGFTQAEIDGLMDHRELLLVEKARKYDELMKAKETAETKKAPPKPEKTLKPKVAEAPRASRRPGHTANDDERRAWILSQLDAE